LPRFARNDNYYEAIKAEERGVNYIFHNSSLLIEPPTKLFEIQNCSFLPFGLIFLKPFDFIE